MLYFSTVGAPLITKDKEARLLPIQCVFIDVVVGKLQYQLETTLRPRIFLVAERLSGDSSTIVAQLLYGLACDV